jgi:hypothetical protein
MLISFFKIIIKYFYIKKKYFKITIFYINGQFLTPLNFISLKKIKLILFIIKYKLKKEKKRKKMKIVILNQIFLILLSINIITNNASVRKAKQHHRCIHDEI